MSYCVRKRKREKRKVGLGFFFKSTETSFTDCPREKKIGDG